MQCQHRKNKLWPSRPRLPDVCVTGLGHHEQQAGLLRGEQRHEERMEAGLRGGGIQYLITAQKLCCKYKRSQCFLNSVQSQVTYRVYHTGNAYVTLGYQKLGSALTLFCLERMKVHIERLHI